MFPFGSCVNGVVRASARGIGRRVVAEIDEPVSEIAAAYGPVPGKPGAETGKKVSLFVKGADSVLVRLKVAIHPGVPSADAFVLDDKVSRQGFAVGKTFAAAADFGKGLCDVLSLAAAVKAENAGRLNDYCFAVDKINLRKTVVAFRYLR